MDEVTADERRGAGRVRLRLTTTGQKLNIRHAVETEIVRHRGVRVCSSNGFEFLSFASSIVSSEVLSGAKDLRLRLINCLFGTSVKGEDLRHQVADWALPASYTGGTTRFAMLGPVYTRSDNGPVRLPAPAPSRRTGCYLAVRFSYDGRLGQGGDCSLSIFMTSSMALSSWLSIPLASAV